VRNVSEKIKGEFNNMAKLPEYKPESAFVNVKRPVYAMLTTESATSEQNVYGAIKAVSPMMSVKMNSDINSDTLYGDGVSQAIAETKGATTLEIGVNTVSQEFLADTQGHELKNGVLIEKDDDVSKYIAIGFAIEKENGKHRAYWLLKGKVEEVDVDASQKEEKISFSTPTLKGSFVARKDKIRIVSFDEETDAGTTPWANYEEFLAEVPLKPKTEKAGG
jgi:phi13 family phage major tail protein